MMCLEQWVVLSSPSHFLPYSCDRLLLYIMYGEPHLEGLQCQVCSCLSLALCYAHLRNVVQFMCIAQEQVLIRVSVLCKLQLVAASCSECSNIVYLFIYLFILHYITMVFSTYTVYITLPWYFQLVYNTTQ